MPSENVGRPEDVGRPENVGRRKEARRRLLNDMGVDVWYRRAPAGSIAGVAGPSREAGRRTGVGAEIPTGAVVRRGAGDSPPAEPARVETAPPGLVPAPAKPQDAAPFAVVALGAPGALLVVPAFSRRGEAALARDIVRAARRDWQAAVAQARFDWPQPGLTGESAPALAAFVEKQAEDFDAQLMLVSESAARYLGSCPLRFVTVPDLSSLSEPLNKLRLWRQLKELTA